MRLSVGHLLIVSRTGMKSFANQMFDRTGHEQIEHGGQNNLLDLVALWDVFIQIWVGGVGNEQQ